MVDPPIWIAAVMRQGPKRPSLAASWPVVIRAHSPGSVRAHVVVEDVLRDLRTNLLARAVVKGVVDAAENAAPSFFQRHLPETGIVARHIGRRGRSGRGRQS